MHEMLRHVCILHETPIYIQAYLCNTKVHMTIYIGIQRHTWMQHRDICAQNTKSCVRVCIHICMHVLICTVNAHAASLAMNFSLPICSGQQS